MAAQRSVDADTGTRNNRRGFCTNRRRIWVDNSNRPVTLEERSDPHFKGTSKYVAGDTVRCCAECAVRQGWAVQELIRRGLAEAQEGTYVAFLTLTEPAESRDFAEHSKACGRFLGDLFRAMGRGHTSVEHPYLGVRELQHRGAWHSHYLVLNWPYMRMELVRALAVKHGLGWRFNVKVRVVGRGYSVEGLSVYLTKTLSGYLTKVTGNELLRDQAMRHLPKGGRLVVHSGSWAGGLTKSAVKQERLSRWKQRQPLRHDQPSLPVLGSDEWWGWVHAALVADGVVEVEPHPPPAAAQQGLLPGL